MTVLQSGSSWMDGNNSAIFVQTKFTACSSTCGMEAISQMTFSISCGTSSVAVAETFGNLLGDGGHIASPACQSKSTTVLQSGSSFIEGKSLEIRAHTNSTPVTSTSGVEANTQTSSSSSLSWLC
jgi:hypothetical protein